MGGTIKILNDYPDILFKYIDNKKLKDSDVYNKVNLDRRLFSKIRCDEDYNPSKETVLIHRIDSFIITPA